jgi:hypothetical protein
MDSVSMNENYVQLLVERTEKGYSNIISACTFYGVCGDRFVGLLVLHCCLGRVVFLVWGQTDKPVNVTFCHLGGN